ncbi:MAG: glycosyltransferase family 2 protein [Pseudolabrys sp.]|nr:glycosyltransferase family 2 protein [Pseudolabrys sp.]
MPVKTTQSDAPRVGKSRPGHGLSIVVPVYNEAKGLGSLHQRIAEAARFLQSKYGLAIEVVYVDDGSADNTGHIAKTLPALVLDIQVVTLSRNFGKEAALLAGLDHARLGAVLFMDGDGQHPPSLIETLVSRWLDDGYDVIYTAKAHRENEHWLRRISVHGFYWLLNWHARLKIPEDAGDFRLLSPRAANALRQMPERNRFFKGLSSWIGFRQVRVDYEPANREHGVTTWNVWSLIGLSIEGLTSFSVAPLRVASLLGVVMSASALMFGVWTLIETLLFGRDVPGYPSLVVGLMVLGGVQLMMIGVLGEYIGKLLSESKGRPVYFVAEHSVKRAHEPAPNRSKTEKTGAAKNSAKPRPPAARPAE